MLLPIAYLMQVHAEPKFKSQPFPSLSEGIQDSVFTTWLPETSCLILKFCANKMNREKGLRVLVP